MVESMSVLEPILGELHDREAYLCDVYAPYYVYSYAIHAFNLYNQQAKVYWEGGQLPNMRLHIMFVAPSGFMKSYYRKQMTDRQYGIFTGCKVEIGYKQSLTEAGLVGTYKPFKDPQHCTDIEVDGVAKIYKDAILTIDEFSGITNAMGTSYNNQMESQLLMILDSGEVMKTLGSGNIDYITYLTLWAGVQPSKFDLRGGMGRRSIFLVFIPSKYDNTELIKAQHRAHNIAQDKVRMTGLWNEVDMWIDNINNIERVDFDESLTDYYLKSELNSFEVSYFNRLAFGFELAHNGPRKHMNIDAHDKRLQKLFTQQKQWRDQVLIGIEIIQMAKLISMGGVEDKDGNITIDRRKLMKDSTMVGWNAFQVNEKLKELMTQGFIRIRGHNITLEGDIC